MEFDFQNFKKSSFLFIIGRSRSGTTLLRTMLDMHPNISVPNECTFILQLSRKYNKITIWTQKIKDEFIIDLKKTWLFENLKINTEYLRNNLNRLSYFITYEEICKLVILHSSSSVLKKDLIYVGDKNPSYSLYLKTIYSLFNKDCKYIYINRDYSDQYLSLKNAKFEIPNAVVSAKRWVKAFKNFKKFSKENAENILIIQYEDLVNNPEKELLKICLFLGVPFDKSMLQFNTTEYLLSSFTEESLNGIHKSINEPLTNKKINSWKNNLPQTQLKILDKIAGRHMNITGYKPSTNINIFYFLLISLPGYCLYWLTLLFSQTLKCISFNLYLKLSGGAFLGKIWNHYFRKQ